MDQSELISLGVHDLYETELQLDLLIFYTYQEDGNVDIEMKIPLPANYPETDIKFSDLVHSTGLFSAILTVHPEENWNSTSLEIITETLGIVARYIIMLAEFFIIPKRENIYMTSEEIIFFRGLGKKALCRGLSAIIKRLRLNTKKSVFLLYASGGKIQTLEDEIRVQEYETSDDLLEIYETKYPSDFYSYEDLPTLSKHEIAELLVETENNERLINYYESAFGLIPLDDIGAMTLMGAPLKSFVGHCI